MGCSALNCDDEVKWEAEEDEALSLTDLPVNLIKEENKIQTKNEEDGDEDFNFGLLGGSLSTEQDMCVADEVFFQGQILPLRLSVSSDSGLKGCRQDSLSTSRLLSRSESMDHGSLSRFASASSSSRSSSFNSISNASLSCYKSKPMKTRNNFNTHPSPKPNVRLSNSRPVNVSSRIQRSSLWDLFRLGLVRAPPELELKDLKARSTNNNDNNVNKHSVSRNSSCTSSNSSSNTKNSTIKIVNKSGEVVAKGFLGKRIGSFSGCKCSVNAVETVQLNNAAMEDKNKKLVQEFKVKKKNKEKQALSRNRTFEWLKELSHGSYIDVALKRVS